MSWARFRAGFPPWAGLALGTAGYFLAHQVGSDSAFENCRTGSPLVVAIGTIAGLAVIGFGAFGSWRIYRSPDEGPARRLIAIVGLLACLLYAIGAILPLVAAIVIPGCWA